MITVSPVAVFKTPLGLLGVMRRLYVYILECEDKSFYVGVTNNLKRRLEEHNSKLHPESYTAVRLPVRLVHFTAFDSPLKAIAFEKQLKKWSRAKKEAYIASDWEKLKSLSACRNATASCFYKLRKSRS